MLSWMDKGGVDRRRSGDTTSSSKSPGDPAGHKPEVGGHPGPPGHSVTVGGENSAALPQRERGARKQEKTRTEVQSELKDFKDKFTLTTSEGGQQPAHAQSNTPTVSINPNPPNQAPKQPSPIPPEVQQKTSPVPPPSKTSPKPGTPPQMSAPPPTTPTAAPPTTPGNNDSVKKSTLNPNAKEFTLNPKAQEFTPRSQPVQRPGN